MKLKLEGSKHLVYLTNQNSGKDDSKASEEERQENAKGGSTGHQADATSSVVNQTTVFPAQNVYTERETYIYRSQKIGDTQLLYHILFFLVWLAIVGYLPPAPPRIQVANLFKASINKPMKRPAAMQTAT